MEIGFVWYFVFCAPCLHRGVAKFLSLLDLAGNITQDAAEKQFPWRPFGGMNFLARVLMFVVPALAGVKFDFALRVRMSTLTRERLVDDLRNLWVCTEKSI
jgi:hypothetical protein